VIFKFFFWFSFLALVLTYVLYPISVILIARRKKDNTLEFKHLDDFPGISIILAVRNQEQIIERKIESVLNCRYPVEKLNFYIGSDASDDNTDLIIARMALKYKSIKFVRFNQRMGKIQIINELASAVEDHILVFTDAHAIFDNDALFNLIKHFKNQDIHVVGGRMKNSISNPGIIAFQERSYFELEYKLKQGESRIWGCMMGAFGSFYAIRKKFWKPVPDNFIGDDFYISLKAIEKTGKAIFEPKAFVYENVPGNMKEEFKRKARIATGNFQNLSVLYPILFSGRWGVAFSFFFHKILRWLGPVFIILILISLSSIFYINLTYTILFIIMILSLLAILTDFFLKKIQIHIVLLRFISHFFYMNLALLVGMFRFMKGVKSNVWEPTKRE